MKGNNHIAANCLKCPKLFGLVKNNQGLHNLKGIIYKILKTHEI